MQHVPIGRERLPRAGRPAGSDERNEIGRLQLTVDKLVERSSRVLEAFNGQSQVVNHHSQCALDVCALWRRRRTGVASAMELEIVPLGSFAAETRTGMNWAKVTV